MRGSFAPARGHSTANRMETWHNLAQTSLTEVTVLRRRTWSHAPNFRQSVFAQEILKDRTWAAVTSDPAVESSGCYVDHDWESVSAVGVRTTLHVCAA